MERALPALKARADLIAGVLEIIRDNEGNYSKIEEAVIDFWRRESSRKKPPTSRNSMRAVFGPTLRHLYLIRGERDDIKLLPPGKKLLEEYEKGGERAYKKTLARHLVKLDNEKWLNILGYLRESNKKHTFSELLDTLRQRAPDSGINNERLTKFLLYCEYVGLVYIRNRFVALRASQYKISVQSTYKQLSDKEFFRLLHQQYELLRSRGEGSPYVPIPDLRDSVCEKGEIWLDDFDKKLKNIPKETDDYLVQLTQPMVRKPKGITIGGKYLYYIAIYKKERLNE